MKILGEGVVNLARWLRRQVEEGCSRVSLRQKTPTSEQHVCEWSLSADRDADELADEIQARAEEDARQLRGCTLYGVFSYRGTSKRCAERTLLRVGSEDTNSGGGSGGVGRAILEGSFETYEGSTDVRGITSQLMRHNEISARLALSQTADIIEYYKRALDARDRRIEELEGRHLETLKLYEKLTSLQHDRDIELLREQRADQRGQFMREKLDMLAPVLMSKFLGGSSKAGSGALGEELMRQFLKSLSPDQIDALMGMLRPEQAAVIGEVYEAYAKRETAHGAPTNAPSTKTTNGVAVKAAAKPLT